MLANVLAAALRNLSRNRLHAGVTIACLALGFATALLIAVFVRYEYSYDRMYPHHERTFMVLEYSEPPGSAPEHGSPIFEPRAGPLIQQALPSAEAVTRIGRSEPVLRRGSVEGVEPRFVWADANLFDVLPQKVIAGDVSQALARPDGLVLTRSLARKYFGRDDPIGETLTIDPARRLEINYTALVFSHGRDLDPNDLPTKAWELPQAHAARVMAVIEDIPADTHLLADAFGSSLSPLAPHQSIQNAEVHVYVRLKRGGRRHQAEQALTRSAKQLPPAAWRDLPAAIRLHPITALHMDPQMAQDLRERGHPEAMRLLLLMAALILVLAGANFITLMTARAGLRAREVGVRKAAGARRLHLVAQFMGEALLYAGFAMLVAVALAEVLLPWLNALLSRQMSIHLLDPWVAGCIVGLTLGVGLLAGCYPALVLSSFRPATVLKGGPVASPGSGLVREGLVALQFAILVGLAMGALTVYRQNQHFVSRSLSVVGEHTLNISAPCTDAFLDRLRSTAGVREATCIKTFIEGPSRNQTRVFDTRGKVTKASVLAVDPAVLDFFRLRPIAGRPLPPPAVTIHVELFTHGWHEQTSDGQSPGPPRADVVVINEAASKALGFDRPQAAVGRIIAWEGQPTGPCEPGQCDQRPRPKFTSTVIGVIPDFPIDAKAPNPHLYYSQGERGQYGVGVRLSADSLVSALPKIDGIWREMGNPRPLDREFYEERLRKRYRRVTELAAVTTAGGAAALLIACLGVFALSAFVAQQRIKEIGVRKCMGARTSHVLALLLVRFARPVLLGNLIALPIAGWILSRWLENFAVRTTLAPWTFAVVVAGSLALALGTVLLYALSAARTSPVDALRYE